MKPSWHNLVAHQTPLSAADLNSIAHAVMAMARSSGPGALVGGAGGISIAPGPTFRRWAVWEIVSNQDDGVYHVRRAELDDDDTEWPGEWTPEEATADAQQYIGVDVALRDWADEGWYVPGILADTREGVTTVFLDISFGHGIRFGKPASAFSSGTTITLAPCDQDGDALSATLDNVTIKFNGADERVTHDIGTSDVVAFAPIPADDSGNKGIFLGVIPTTRVRLGKPTSAYTSGATITLDPCDPAGTDNGEANVTVQAGWTLPANTNIPTTAIIPFALAANGNWYVLGDPKEVITNIQYDTSTHKLQKKVRYDFGWFCTTESSSWVDITTAVDCTSA